MQSANEQPVDCLNDSLCESRVRYKQGLWVWAIVVCRLTLLIANFYVEMLIEDYLDLH